MDISVNHRKHFRSTVPCHQAIVHCFTVFNDHVLFLLLWFVICNETRYKSYKQTDRFASLILISFIPSIYTDALIVATHHVSDRFSAKGILDQTRGYSTTGTDQAVVP